MLDRGAAVSIFTDDEIHWSNVASEDKQEWRQGSQFIYIGLLLELHPMLNFPDVANGVPPVEVDDMMPPGILPANAVLARWGWTRMRA